MPAVTITLQTGLTHTRTCRYPTRAQVGRALVPAVTATLKTGLNPTRACRHRTRATSARPTICAGLPALHAITSFTKRPSTHIHTMHQMAIYTHAHHAQNGHAHMHTIHQTTMYALVDHATNRNVRACKPSKGRACTCARVNTCLP